MSSDYSSDSSYDPEDLDVYFSQAVGKKFKKHKIQCTINGDRSPYYTTIPLRKNETIPKKKLSKNTFLEDKFEENSNLQGPNEILFFNSSNSLFYLTNPSLKKFSMAFTYGEAFKEVKSFPLKQFNFLHPFHCGKNSLECVVTRNIIENYASINDLEKELGAICYRIFEKITKSLSGNTYALVYFFAATCKIEEINNGLTSGKNGIIECKTQIHATDFHFFVHKYDYYYFNKFFFDDQRDSKKKLCNYSLRPEFLVKDFFEYKTKSGFENSMCSFRSIFYNFNFKTINDFYAFNSPIETFISDTFVDSAKINSIIYHYELLFKYYNNFVCFDGGQIEDFSLGSSKKELLFDGMINNLFPILPELGCSDNFFAAIKKRFDFNKITTSNLTLFSRGEMNFSEKITIDSNLFDCTIYKHLTHDIEFTPFKNPTFVQNFETGFIGFYDRKSNFSCFYTKRMKIALGKLSIGENLYNKKINHYKTLQSEQYSIDEDFLNEYYSLENPFNETFNSRIFGSFKNISPMSSSNYMVQRIWNEKYIKSSFLRHFTSKKINKTNYLDFLFSACDNLNSNIFDDIDEKIPCCFVSSKQPIRIVEKDGNTFSFEASNDGSPCPKKIDVVDCSAFEYFLFNCIRIYPIETKSPENQEENEKHADDCSKKIFDALRKHIGLYFSCLKYFPTRICKRTLNGQSHFINFTVNPFFNPLMYIAFQKQLLNTIGKKILFAGSDKEIMLTRRKTYLMFLLNKFTGLKEAKEVLNSSLNDEQTKFKSKEALFFKGEEIIGYIPCLICSKLTDVCSPNVLCSSNGYAFHDYCLKIFSRVLVEETKMTTPDFSCSIIENEFVFTVLKIIYTQKIFSFRNALLKAFRTSKLSDVLFLLFSGLRHKKNLGADNLDIRSFYELSDDNACSYCGETNEDLMYCNGKKVKDCQKVCDHSLMHLNFSCKSCFYNQKNETFSNKQYFMGSENNLDDQLNNGPSPANANHCLMTGGVFGKINQKDVEKAIYSAAVNYNNNYETTCNSYCNDSCQYLYKKMHAVDMRVETSGELTLTAEEKRYYNRSIKPSSTPNNHKACFLGNPALETDERKNILYFIHPSDCIEDKMLCTEFVPQELIKRFITNYLFFFPVLGEKKDYIFNNIKNEKEVSKDDYLLEDVFESVELLRSDLLIQNFFLKYFLIDDPQKFFIFNFANFPDENIATLEWMTLILENKEQLGINWFYRGNTLLKEINYETINFKLGPYDFYSDDKAFQKTIKESSIRKNLKRALIPVISFLFITFFEKINDFDARKHIYAPLIPCMIMYLNNINIYRDIFTETFLDFSCGTIAVSYLHSFLRNRNIKLIRYGKATYISLVNPGDIDDVNDVDDFLLLRPNEIVSALRFYIDYVPQKFSQTFTCFTKHHKNVNLLVFKKRYEKFNFYKKMNLEKKDFDKIHELITNEEIFINSKNIEVFLLKYSLQRNSILFNHNSFKDNNSICLEKNDFQKYFDGKDMFEMMKNLVKEEEENIFDYLD